MGVPIKEDEMDDPAVIEGSPNPRDQIAALIFDAMASARWKASGLSATPREQTLAAADALIQAGLTVPAGMTAKKLHHAANLLRKDMDWFLDSRELAVDLDGWADLLFPGTPPPPVMFYNDPVDDDLVDNVVDGENTTLMRELIYRLWERVKQR